MNIKKTANLLINFTIKRISEIIGITVFASGILLMSTLLTYSPEDPNFIFPDNTEIKNILGFQGSFISDLFFQSIGLIAYLFPLTLLFSGINIFLTKDIFLIIENIFFSILYLYLVPFFTYFYSNAFTLYINGNGGFIGSYLDKSLFNFLIKFNETASYYILIFIIIFFFLVSIKFNLKNFYNFLKKTSKFFIKNKERNYTDKSEIINEYIPQDEIKNLIQEDLPFIKAENKNNDKIKFKLPSLDLLKLPTKKEKEALIKMKLMILNF